MLARRQALGARLGTQARALGVLALGRWALGAGLGVQARRQQAWQQALGRAGTARACADGRWACGRASRTRGRARRVRHARHGREDWRWRAGQEHAAGRREGHGLGARGARPGRAWARLVHWLGQFGAHAASLGFDLGF